MNINLVQANWELYNKASDKQKREFIVSYIGSEVTEEKMILFCLFLMVSPSFCLLYPIDSESREVKSLDGVWKFQLSPSLNPEMGFASEWYKNKSLWKDSMDMPVPSSFNDITTDSLIRDFVGWAWYYRTFFVPSSWKNQVST